MRVVGTTIEQRGTIKHLPAREEIRQTAEELKRGEKRRRLEAISRTSGDGKQERKEIDGACNQLRRRRIELVFTVRHGLSTTNHKQLPSEIAEAWRTSV